MRLFWLYLSLLVAFLVGCGAQTGEDGRTPSPEKEETSAAGNPTTARVVCDGDGARVLTPKVAARPDGVHLSIDNRLEGSAERSVSHREGGVGWSVPSGESGRIANVPPGKVQIDCFGRSWGRGRIFGMEIGTMLVSAGDSGYKSPKLDCPRGKLAGDMGSHIGESETGALEGSPTNLLRRELSGSLEGSDVVEIAGNTRNADEKTVRVLRDGAVIANAHYFRVSDGWLGGLTENCAGLGAGRTP